MIESTITSRGRTTLPKAVREALGVGPGDRVRYVILDDGAVRILPVLPISSLFGMLKYDGPTVTLRDMEDAIPPSPRDRGTAGGSNA
ncbi:MAG: type II toxin-antitoxin system PrlF family antitoxin [Defluviicoccus sp.]|nr:type II toxin-antitoxin system PrlF family antitoxin [Defluviicoccus sp.]MDE0385465.1 type II toxin-antitoxin system PrlF family antitoxin [Defluviicoccus sp.]